MEACNNLDQTKEVIFMLATNRSTIFHMNNVRQNNTSQVPATGSLKVYYHHKMLVSLNPNLHLYSATIQNLEKHYQIVLR